MSTADRAAAWSWRWWIAWALLLGASYSLLPLYSSNQNHHFLIGLARAGEGWLADDWLASTADPFPLFTAFVAFVHRHLSDVLHYVVYLGLFGAYGYGLMRIAEYVWPVPPAGAWPARLAFLAVLCVLHNEVVGYLVGIDRAHLSWWQMTHWGVAEQEIFGHGAFQASSFGMLLPLAISFYLAERPIVASALCASAVAIHFSYALTVGAIVIGVRPPYTTPIGSGERTKRHNIRARWRHVTARLGSDPLWFLCLLTAMALAAGDVYLRLGPTSADASARAAAILVEHLPQETLVSHWFGWRTIVQLAWMLIALRLTTGTRLFAILLAPFAAGTALTLWQAATGGPRLALLFPWRVSVLLVPIATALAVRKGVDTLLRGAGPSRARAVTIAATIALVASAALGVARMALHFAYFYGDTRVTRITDRFLPDRWRADFARVLQVDAIPMMRYVRSTAARGDLYVIPPELERFRLVSGAPALADLKSHPYKDVEVLEWRRRLDDASAVYSSRPDCTTIDALADRYGVTHVVADWRLHPFSCPRWFRTYDDGTFAIYRSVLKPMLK